MEVRIREVTVGDAASLGAAHVAAWQVGYQGLMPSGYLSRLDPQTRAEGWRRTIETGDSRATTLVALVGDRVAGFTSYGPPRDDVPDGWGELWALNMHPDFWRQGIGTALFTAATSGLVGLGYRHGYLWVLQGNERAIAFYRRQGWLPDRVTKIDDRQDFDPPLVELRCSTTLPTGGELLGQAEPARLGRVARRV